MRVMVLHHHVLARGGLVAMLNGIPFVDVVYEAETSGAAFEMLKSEPVDVLLVNSLASGLDMESMRGIGGSDMKVLVLLPHNSPDELTVSVYLPGDGYLVEPEVTRDALADALVRVERGEAPIPDALARQLLLELRRGGRAPRFLTPREQEVLKMLADGLSNKAIARRIGISEHGAKRHVANILAKLNSGNRTLAVARAMQEGLLDRGAGTR